MDPLNPYGHRNLFFYYLDQGETAAATKEIKLAAHQSLHRADVDYAHLGVLFTRMGRLKEAERFLRRSLRMNPLSPRAINNLGIVYAASGRPVKALSCFERALRICPQFTPAYDGLGLLYAGILDDSKKAREIWLKRQVLLKSATPL